MIVLDDEMHGVVGDGKVTCSGDCQRLLDLDGAKACAILICGRCRKNTDILRQVRAEMNKHLRQHLIEERKTNSWYPFEDFHAAWNAA